MNTKEATTERIEFWQGKLPNKYNSIPSLDRWLEIIAYHRHDFDYVGDEIRGNFHNNADEYVAYILNRVASNVNFEATYHKFVLNF